MKFVVLSKSKAKEASFDEPWAAIQIATHKDDWPKLSLVKNLGTLQIHFADSDGQQKDIPWTTPEEAIIFNKEHANLILDFVSLMQEKVNLFLIHCEAGRSRSPGVAAALSKIYNDDDMEYFKMFTPNMLVYRTILQTYYNGRPTNE